MRTTHLSLAAAATLALAPMAFTTGTADAAPNGHHGHHSAAPGKAARALAKGVAKKHLCTSPKKGEAACNAIRLENASGTNVDQSGKTLGSGIAKPAVSTDISGGLTPVNVQDAYRVTGAKSGGRVVAVVDAYGYPNAEADLATYRKTFGLGACTKANGCLSVRSQSGSTTSLPAYNAGWAGETALDLDAVSAICPDCRIALVQANSANTADLAAAENTAAKIPGVVAISNSYGSVDIADSALGSAYNHPGIAITASTGDDGYTGPSFPASSHYVTAVGGTSLSWSNANQWWSESAWAGAGSGCTTKNAAPAGQTVAMTGCTGRASADVSAVADPSTGLAVYGPGGWGIVGGTSLSAPLVAGMYALSGNTAGYANTLPYAHADQFFDIADGSNGTCANWCAARTGWDGPTGVGSPNGLGGL